jgi:apolipoprotein N-acyltransferase
VKRDGFGLGFFTTLTIGAWWLCFDFGYQNERKAALITLVLFVVLATMACHFLLNVIDRAHAAKTRWRAETNGDGEV